MDKYALDQSDKMFVTEEFEHLPLPIQRYVKNCGYIGTPKMSSIKTEFFDVHFMQSRKGPAIKIDYTVYNYVKEPCRIALIDSSMFGVPFEGYDYYTDGIGGMKGVIGKFITIFHQKGTHMDKASLVTFLAESFFAPTIFLQGYIAFEEINDYEVKASITHNNVTAGGIFRFNEKYEMTSFTTTDRGNIANDGTITYIPWTAVCKDYQKNKAGIMTPTSFQAVWNYDDGDGVYFDGVISSIEAR